VNKSAFDPSLGVEADLSSIVPSPKQVFYGSSDNAIEITQQDRSEGINQIQFQQSNATKRDLS